MLLNLLPVTLASLWDLVPWIPFVVILMVLSAYGIVFRSPHGPRPRWDDKDDYP